MTAPRRKQKTEVVRYEQDREGWWVASIPGIPNCNTQGKTIEQARERIREALVALVGEKKAWDYRLVDGAIRPKKLTLAQWILLVELDGTKHGLHNLGGGPLRATISLARLGLATLENRHAKLTPEGRKRAREGP